MAHKGVLFLDELGEFRPHLLDALRQPLEEGKVTIARKGASVTFPAAVQLVAATNPCPCGFNGNFRQGCVCTDRMVQRYRRRLSGPLLDRFDIRVQVNPVDPDAMIGPPEEPSHQVAARVAMAVSAQQARGRRNRDLSRRHLDALEIATGAERLIEGALRHGALTGRGFDRVRRLARTIADLDGSASVEEEHASQALVLRGSP
jgi:magnesium chelatase family protein